MFICTQNVDLQQQQMRLWNMAHTIKLNIYSLLIYEVHNLSSNSKISKASYWKLCAAGQQCVEIQDYTCTQVGTIN